MAMKMPLEASRPDAAEVDEVPSLLALDEQALSHVNRGSGLEPVSYTHLTLPTKA